MTQEHGANSMGRPSIYSDELVETICARLAKGEPMASICRDDDMPGVTTLHSWGIDNKHVSESIARARLDGFDSIALDGLNIVDDLSEDPASRRVRSDYRLKLLAKWDPKRYGDLLKLGGEPGMPINHNVEATVRFVRVGDED